MQMDLATAKEYFEKYGQGHIFEGVDELRPEEVDEFLCTLKDIDMDLLVRKLSEGYELKQKTAADISPFSGPHIDLTTTDLQAELFRYEDTGATDSDALKAFAAGLEHIARGQVAVVLMAGGQGSRLGFDHPKGMFPLPPIAPSIFSIHAQRIRRLLALAKQAHPSSSPSLPWLVMTSAATDAETRAFFEQEDFFGLPEHDVMFFQQGLLPPVQYVPLGAQGGHTHTIAQDTQSTAAHGRLPVLSVPGRGDVGVKLVLEAPGRLSLSPNGNGGLYAGLSPHLSTLLSRGVEFVHIVGVDNVLVRVADPVMVGFMASAGLAVVNKVVVRRDASEKVGVMARRGGHTTIVEYSELGAKAAERLPSGALAYAEANIVSMLFHASFLARCVAHAADLPLHLAEDKAVATRAGPVRACKMEMFMFDVLEWAGEPLGSAAAKGGEESAENAESAHGGKEKVWIGVGTVRGRREHEFAPVKNKDDAGVDCPASACALVMQYHRELLRGAHAHAHAHGRAETDAWSEEEVARVGARTYAGEGLRGDH